MERADHSFDGEGQSHRLSVHSLNDQGPFFSQYDRIDPSEMQSLKDELEQLKTLKTSIESTVTEKDQELAAKTDRVCICITMCYGSDAFVDGKIGKKSSSTQGILGKEQCKDP
jgi:hypothetical protein